MYCVFLGRAVGTVNAPAGSVGNSQTASTIITGQTAETTVADDDTVLIHDTSASALKKMTVSNLTANAGLDGWSSNSGNLLPADASKGIYLGVNSATAANLLDDYEVGTWTPSVASTSGSFTTVGTVAGYYTKIGNMVHFQADIRITTNGTASANINVNGLPFTSANPGLDHTVNMARETQINGATFTTIISANVTQLVMLSPPFGNGAGYCINGVYRV